MAERPSISRVIARSASKAWALAAPSKGPSRGLDRARPRRWFFVLLSFCCSFFFVYTPAPLRRNEDQDEGPRSRRAALGSSPGPRGAPPRVEPPRRAPRVRALGGAQVALAGIPRGPRDAPKAPPRGPIRLPGGLRQAPGKPPRGPKSPPTGPMALPHRATGGGRARGGGGRDEEKVRKTTTKARDTPTRRRRVRHMLRLSQAWGHEVSHATASRASLE